MIKEIDPIAAFNMLDLQKEAILIDVRSTMEYEFVGHPLQALHVPLQEPPTWEMRPGFVDEVRFALTKRQSVARVLARVLENTPLLMLCRSGARSKRGGELLIEDGFTHVYNVLNGFEGDKDDKGHRNTINGWRFHGLPWEQS